MRIKSVTRYLLLILTITNFLNNASQAETYVNQSGSEMKIEFGDDGKVTGYYITALGCEVGSEKPLVGWANGSAIQFSVNFGDCGSITSWVGHIQEDGTIETIWTLARGDAGWDQKLTGVSTFSLVN